MPELIQPKSSEQGGALIEFALIVPIVLIPLFFGMVEIMNFIQIKSKVDKVVNQAADVLSKTSSWSNGSADAQTILTQTAEWLGPEAVNLRIVLCENSNLVSRTENGVSGKCGGGALAGEYSGVNATGGCLTAPINLRKLQYVVVSGACSYTPTINVFRFVTNSRIFRDRVIIRSNTIAPMTGTL